MATAGGLLLAGTAVLGLLAPGSARASSVPADSADVVVAIAGDAPALDLSACIQLAQEQNLQMLAGRDDLAQLRALAIQARADGLPSIDLLGAWSRGRDPSFAFDATFGGGGELTGSTGGTSGCDSVLSCLSTAFSGFIPAPQDIPAQTFWRGSVSASWELNPVRVINAVRGAQVGLTRQGFVLEDIEHRTAEAVTQGYYQVLLERERVAALDAEMRARREFLDITRRRQSLDLATGLDTLQAAVSLANLVPQRRRAQQALQTAGEELNVLLGRAPTSPLSLIVEYPIEHDPLDGLDAAQRALQRPDLWQLSLNEEFLRRRRAVQKAEIYPSLSLAASYGYVTRRLPELTHLGHDFWSASMSVSLPLFDGLSTRGQVKETEALIRRAQHERMDAQRRAQAEVMQTLGELEAARANLTSSELNMQLAEAAMEQTTLRYRLGKGDYLSVLNAQTDRYQARSNLILARFEVLTGTAKLKRALGASPTAPLSSVLAAVPSQAVESEQ